MKTENNKGQSFIYVIKSDNGFIDLIEDYNYKGDYCDIFEVVVRIKMPVRDFYVGTVEEWDRVRMDNARAILKDKRPAIYNKLMENWF